MDAALARQYLSAFHTLAELGASGEPDLKLLARMNDVLSVTYAEEDRPAVLELALRAADEACAQITGMRAAEGEKICRDMLLKLDCVEELVERIKFKSQGAAREYSQRLRRRLEELLEELVRLGAHLSGMRTYMSQKGPLGRKLDFILQEINREVNTIGSKAMDIEIQSWVVDIKGELEKLREQVQNIE